MARTSQHLDDVFTLPISLTNKPFGFKKVLPSKFKWSLFLVLYTGRSNDKWLLIPGFGFQPRKPALKKTPSLLHPLENIRLASVDSVHHSMSHQAPRSWCSGARGTPPWKRTYPQWLWYRKKSVKRATKTTRFRWECQQIGICNNSSSEHAASTSQKSMICMICMMFVSPMSVLPPLQYAF